MNPIDAKQAATIAEQAQIPESFEQCMEEIYRSIKANAEIGKRVFLYEIFLCKENVNKITSELSSKGFEVEVDISGVEFYSNELIISW